MTADYTFEVFAQGPVRYTPPTGEPFDSFRFRYEANVQNLDAAFQEYAQRRAREGIDVLNFTIEGEWDIEARNFAHAVAHGGEGPAEAFSAGFIFAHGNGTASEYWLESYSLEPEAPVPMDAILAQWGPKEAPKSSSSLAVENATVVIRASSFVNSTVNVRAGGSVEWLHQDGSTLHTVTSDDNGAFDSSPNCLSVAPLSVACMKNGDNFRHEFAKAGRYGYHCKIHPNMTGFVVVETPSP